MALVGFSPTYRRQESAFCALQWRRCAYFFRTCAICAPTGTIGRHTCAIGLPTYTTHGPACTIHALTCAIHGPACATEPSPAPRLVFAAHKASSLSPAHTWYVHETFTPGRFLCTYLPPNAGFGPFDQRYVHGFAAGRPISGTYPVCAVMGPRGCFFPTRAPKPPIPCPHGRFTPTRTP